MKILNKLDIQDILMLTPLQEGMLFHYLHEPNSEHYFEQLSLEISGEIDLELFKKAWNAVIKANGVLRTVFRWEKLEKPTQIILKEHTCPIIYYDLSAEAPPHPNTLLQKLKENDRHEPFDLQQVPFRIMLCKVTASNYHIIISNHHILYDGWSNGIILKEFFKAYHQLNQGKEPIIPVKPSFKEFIKWIQNLDRQKQEQFWQDYLAGADTQTELPVKTRKTTEIKRVEEYTLLFQNEIKNNIATFVKNNRVTLASLFYTTWGLLLQKYCNSEDVFFGTTVSGRPAQIKGIEDIVGLFINTIPLRIQTPPDEKIRDIVYRIDHALQAREEFENTPLLDIKNYSSLNSGESLFDTIVAIENYPLDSRLIPQNSPLTIHSYTMTEMTHYDLTVGIMLFNEIEVKFSYNPELFEKETIIKLAAHFKTIIQHTIEHPEWELSQLEIISVDEKNRILYDFNNTAAEYPRNKSIHHLFEEQSRRTPDHIALIGAASVVRASSHRSHSLTQCQLTYAELNNKSTRLSHYLIHHGVLPNNIIAIMLERSIEMVIGILGILKSRAAYLPIDPDYPEERKQFMLADSAAKTLLSKDIIHDAISVSHPTHHPPSIYDPMNLAYVIYTSGSTGKPKGVIVEHRAVVNLLFFLQTHYPLGGTDTYLLKTSYIFDVSVTELFGAFIDGGKLAVLETQGEKDPQIICDWIELYFVTHINFVPSMFNAFTIHLDSRIIPQLSSLKYIFLAGEALSPQYVKKFRTVNTTIRIENIYGPTESTVYASKYSLTHWNQSGSIPIGKPIENLCLYIIDKYCHLQPINIAGELCIAGLGLARGYLNRPELTHDKFFSPSTSFTSSILTHKLYKTGDLARWFTDGNIEFLGRIDQQVKIRGFRIELGEIENQLLKHSKISQAILLAKEDTNQDKYLVAYFVADGTLSDTLLRDYLLKDLPEYMIPSYFIQLEKIPLTPSGKVNPHALPQPKAKMAAIYVAPRNEIEKNLAEIWNAILNRDPLQNPIGINDNFFHIGGHSLKATSLVSRIHKIFNVKIPLSEIFKRPTISQIADYFSHTLAEQYTPITPVEEKEYYQLSSAQKRLYFLQQLDKTGTTYNIYNASLLEGIIDKNRLQHVIQNLIQRHESLRTSFEVIHEEPIQRIHHNPAFAVEYSENFQLEKFIRPFDLSSAPLLRMGLIKLAQARHILIVDMHHIISDGMSIEILVHEFSALYPGAELPPIYFQYKDYAEWQSHEKESKNLLQQGIYWKKEFAGEIPVLDLPIDYSRPPIQSFAGAHIHFELDREITDSIKSLAFQTETTSYMVLLTIYNIFLSKISSQEDIVTGTPVAGRRHADLEKIIGMFVNTLALRNFPSGEKKFTDYLAEVKERSLKGFENQEYQYEDLIEELAITRNPSRNPLFDTMFVLQNTNIQEIEIPDLKIVPYPQESNTSKFDLSLIAVEIGEKLNLAFEYNTELFKRETIARFISYFINTVSAILHDKNTKISAVEIISTEEKNKILYDFNNTTTVYPADTTIPQLFAEQSARTPDHIAIIGATSQGGQLTHAELNKKSHQLAHVLINQGVSPGDIVALMAERSIESIIAILGILKSGAAYLPIDPQYPEERKQFMLADSASKILLTENVIQESTPHTPIIPTIPTIPMNLAYVMYTSGSTGIPKGVLVTHRNVVRLVKHTNYVDFSPGDSILQTGAMEFDASTFEIWGSLLNNLKLVLVNKETILTPEKLKGSIRQYHISTMWMTSPLFNQMWLEDTGIFAGLRNLLVGGDVLYPPHITRLRNTYPHLHIINGYGPTENTTFSTTFLVQQDYTTSIPIGKPIANSTAFIVDKTDRLSPLGVPGELLLGGDGIAMGYLNNPDLTHDKFVSLATLSVSTTPFYRTGDLARWLSDGNIEFLGRLDFQVKVRGFRVELGEIENSLLKHKDISESVVLAKEEIGTEKVHLIAYFVSQKEIEPREFHEYLAGQLPDYMIPSYFIRLEKLPLTATGKIDRKTLPLPEWTANKEYEAPRNELENKLVSIWQSILRVPQDNRIGINDNFFHLGGHSLKASILLGKIHRELKIAIPLGEIFKIPTIKGLAAYIQKESQGKYDPIPEVEAKEYYPLSSVQKRMHVLQQMELSGTGYNMTAMMTLEGQLNIERFAAAFLKLIERHESLRTSFHLINDEPVQIVHQEVEFVIQYENIVRPEDFIRPFDLTHAPLMRVGLTRENSSRYILMVDMHHIIADGTSTGLIMKEIMALYREEKLPPLRIHYKDYAAWQSDQKKKKGFTQQELFWNEQYKEEIPVLNLPVDYSRPLIQSFAGDRIEFELTETETLALKTVAIDQDVTLYMVLLAIYNIWMAKLSGDEDIVIGTPIASRRHEELQDIIGMFVNTLAIRNFPSREKTFNDFLNELKNRTIDAFENQDYPFEELVDHVVKNRDTSRNPLFDVLFVFQNMDIPPIQIPGLTITPCEFKNKTAKFDLNLDGQEKDERLIFTLEYSTKLFKEETIHRFSEYFKNIIYAIISTPDLRISDIQMMAQQEREKILAISNGIVEPVNLDATIHGMFEKIARAHPNKTALVFGEARLTYGELNRRAERLAILLRNQGIGRDNIVGLMVERSFEMVIGMLSIMKAGGAYLAIDLKFPQQRKQFMIQDSHMDTLLTNFELDLETTQISGHIHLLDMRDTTIYKNISPGTAKNIEEKLPHIYKGSDLVYVIFTSGSTGNPKGVMLEHTNLVNLMEFQYQFTNINFSRVLQFTTMSFDVSFQEIFSTLLYGGQLYLIDEDTRNSISDLFQLIIKHEIKTLFFPMSFLKMMFNQDIHLPAGHVEHIVTAGEQVVVDDLFRNYLKHNHIYLHNHYGPSETHVITTLTLSPDQDIPQFPTIGKPVMNTSIYILDKNTHLQPIGIAGELVAGGVQIGRGYLGREEETHTKFIADTTRQNGKLYRTGDMARWLENGNIEFLGRIDHQVKIRGIRVEPGEIESHIKKIPHVKDAIVTVKQELKGEKYLCAYVVINTATDCDVSKLKNILSSDLPDYMIPTYFVPLDKIPLTPSGKVDRRSLPEPDLTSINNYTAPQNRTEQLLVQIWAESLGIEQVKIGRDANFFQLGGHSLKAIGMVNKIHKTFQVKITIQDLFQFPTISRLAAIISTGNNTSFEEIERQPDKPFYELSYPQKRLWYIQKRDPHSTAFNMPVTITLKWAMDEFIIQKALQQLIIRHESLRTYFIEIDKQPMQVIKPANQLKLHLEVVDISHLQAKERQQRRTQLLIEESSFVFNLAEWPLFRAKLVKYDTEEFDVIFNMHHIITDGSSMEILKPEFSHIVDAYKKGLPCQLEPLTIQYKDYAAWHNRWLDNKETVEKAFNFWKGHLSGPLPILSLPYDYSTPSSGGHESAVYRTVISGARIQRLSPMAIEHQASLFMVLLAGFNILMSKITGQKEIVMAIPAAARQHDQLKHIVGMFVNTLILHNHIDNDEAFNSFLNRFKDNTFNVLEYQGIPLEMICTQLQIKYPSVSVFFNMLNLGSTHLEELTNHDSYHLKENTQQAKFDIVCYVTEYKNAIEISCYYYKNRFKPQTIEKMMDLYANILETASTDPAQKIWQLGTSGPLGNKKTLKRITRRQN